MAQLAEQPISFYVILNNQINKVEYGCGHDNPGVYLKANEEHWDQIATCAADEPLPKFQRGKVSIDFCHKRYKTTSVKFHVGDEQTPVDLHIKYDVKLQNLSMTHQKKKELKRKVKFEQLITDPLMIIIPEYRMKVKTLLAQKKDSFNVYLNDVDMYDLKRYIKKEEDGAEQAGESKISAASLKINQLDVFQESKEKSYKGLERTIERKLEENKQSQITSIEVKDLACKTNDLIQMLDMFYAKMLDPEHNDEGVL